LRNINRTDLDLMTQDELLKAVRRLPWESRLNERAGPIAFVLDVLFVYGIYAIGFTNVAVLIYAFFMGGIIIALWLDKLIHFRTRRYRRQLMWRFGTRDFNRLQAEAKTSIRNSSGPNWSIVFFGIARPHGGTIDIKLDLKTSPASGNLSVRWVSKPDFGKEPPFTADASEIVLPPADCSRILDALRNFDIAKSGESQNFVIDGFKCFLAIARRNPCRFKKYSYVMPSFPAPNDTEFGPTIMSLLMELIEPLPHTPLLTGSCDAYGNIQIDAL